VRLQNAGTLPVEHLNVTLQGTRESRGENNLSSIYFKSFDLATEWQKSYMSIVIVMYVHTLFAYSVFLNLHCF